jgi:hypothetical protein
MTTHPTMSVVLHCALLPECAAQSEASFTRIALHHVNRSFSQATSEDRHIWDATAHVLIQFQGAYWRYWKNCPHLPTRWVGLTNSKSTSLCQSTMPPSTKVNLFYSVWEFHVPNSLGQLWNVIDPKLREPLASKNYFMQCGWSNRSESLE